MIFCRLSTNDSSKDGIDYNEVKKQAHLKRRDTIVTTICFNNKEKSQKNSVSTPTFTQAFTRLNGMSKSAQRSTSPKSPMSPPPVKSAPKPMLGSRPAITASFADDTGAKSTAESPKPIVIPMTKYSRDILPAADALSLNRDEKTEKVGETPKRVLPSDLVSRFCRI